MNIYYMYACVMCFVTCSCVYHEYEELYVNMFTTTVVTTYHITYVCHDVLYVCTLYTHKCAGYIIKIIVDVLYELIICRSVALFHPNIAGVSSEEL